MARRRHKIDVFVPPPQRDPWGEYVAEHAGPLAEVYHRSFGVPEPTVEYLPGEKPGQAFAELWPGESVPRKPRRAY